MHNGVRGRASIQRPKIGKTLIVPAALAVTAIFAACGDDEQKAPELAACSTVHDAGTCQFCRDQSGKAVCTGVQGFCVLVPDLGTCEVVA